MALIKCPECGREVSDSAKQCPHCGFTLKTNIDTAKQAALVAGNAVRNGFLKYGESIIPIALLLAGMAYLIIGTFSGAYTCFYVEYRYDDWIILTPFEEFSAFWLPLLGTIILPIVSLLLFRKFRKKIEMMESITMQQPKFTKKVVLWMVFIYIIGFASLAAIFYVYNNDAKENLRRMKSNYSEIENGSQGFHGGSVTGTYTFTMVDGAVSEVYKVILNDDKTAQLIYESGTTVYGHWSSTSVGPDAEFIIRTPTLNNPYAKDKVHIYFREGYVYHDYDQLMSKDPTNRESYTKTN